MAPLPPGRNGRLRTTDVGCDASAMMPLRSPRAGALWLAAYAALGMIALVLLRMRPARINMVPEGHWMSVVERGDTVTYRKIEFPWGEEGIWTMVRLVRGSVQDGDYRMFRMRSDSGRRCLQLASESPSCLWVAYTRDSVVITRADSVHWLFRRIPPQ